jgi:hypothetical protein
MATANKTAILVKRQFPQLSDNQTCEWHVTNTSDAAGMATANKTTIAVKRQFPQLSPADNLIAAVTLERVELEAQRRQSCPQHTKQ